MPSSAILSRSSRNRWPVGVHLYMLDVLGTSLNELLLSGGIVYVTLGTVVGLLFGVIPGIGGPTALALLIPLTFGIDTADAMFLAGGIMGAIPAGGSVSAILLNTPGTAPNAATVYDGYPMTKNGKAGMALGAAAAASALGGLLGIGILLLLLPVARDVIMMFSPPEFFMLGLLGLCAIAASTDGSMIRGLIACAFGLMIAFVGYDQVSGEVRFTLGIEYLWDGVPLVPALIGLFAIAQIMSLCLAGGSITENPAAVRVSRVSDGVAAVFRYYPTLLRGSAIGAIVGAIPGVGGTVAAFLSYSVTAQLSDEPETFGKGNIQGVIAPEAANNAREGGALIPTLAFGIPGSAEMAVFLGLLVLHGLQPGPSLLINHLDVIAALLLSLAVASVLASVLCLAIARKLALITLVDVNLLVPVILAISTVGAYALRGSMYDAIVAVVFGFVGYLMIRFDYPRLPLVIALFLGEVVEVSYRQTMMIASGDWSIFFSRRLSLALLFLVLLSLSVPFIRHLRRMRFTAREAPQ
jgi:putative tricarboxylic transport membrane protein